MPLALALTTTTEIVHLTTIGRAEQENGDGEGGGTYNLNTEKDLIRLVRKNDLCNVHFNIALAQTRKLYLAVRYNFKTLSVS